MKRMMDFKWSSFLKVRLSKSAVAFLATAVVLLALGGCILLSLEKIERMEKQITLLEKKTKNFVTSVKKRDRFLEEYKGADVEFLRNSIEPLVFLKRDREILSKIEEERYTPIKARVEYLSGEANRLQFIPSATRKKGVYAEKEWTIDHRVELNRSDLDALLTAIEGEAFGKPQLIIKKMDLNCEKQSALFSMDLEILQRGPNDGN